MIDIEKLRKETPTEEYFRGSLDIVCPMVVAIEDLQELMNNAVASVKVLNKNSDFAIVNFAYHIGFTSNEFYVPTNPENIRENRALAINAIDILVNAILMNLAISYDKHDIFIIYHSVQNNEIITFEN